MFNVGDIVRISLDKYLNKTNIKPDQRSAICDYDHTECEVVRIENKTNFKLKPVEPRVSSFDNPPINNFLWPEEALEYPAAKIETEEFEDVLFAG